MSRTQETATQVPPGKVPLDYLMYMREIRNTDLSKRTGIPMTEVHRVRNGYRPKEEYRKKIAKAMKVSQADLGWEVSGV